MSAGGPASGGGQIVSSGSATGSIYDLGYRRYDGPRLGLGYAFTSLARSSFRMTYGLGRSARAKIVPMGLAALAIIPAVVALGVTAIAIRAGLGSRLEEASPIRYSTYYSIVAQMVSLFVAAQAPELLGRDLRYRVLALYLTRTLRREDYALAKLVALVGAMLVFILLPQLIIFIGRILVAPDILGSIGKDLPDVPAILAQALLTAGLLGSLGLAIAAFTPRRAYATAGIIAALIVPPIVVAVASQIAGGDLVGPITLLSPADVLIGANAFFFDTTRAGLPGQGIPGWAYPVAGVVWTAALTAILVWRYRRVEP
jgi:ABC-2 type transport system permease protein